MPDALSDICITGVLGFKHSARRHKLIGRNAKKDVHGDVATEPAVRVYTNQGTEGIGFGRITPAEAQGLIGQSLADIWQQDSGPVSSLGRADHALYDLIGKALDRPAWRLMGGHGPAWVPVYDTSLYFSDLLPEHADRGVGRLLDEMEDGLRRGFLAFKVKVGRGARWMDAREGLSRDMQVVRALAKAAPAGVKIMADANDQYGLETAQRFLGEVGEYLTFLEEPFPESVEHGTQLRDWAARNGIDTILADGESEHDPAALYQLGDQGGLDLLQPDIRALGLSLQRRLAHDLHEHPRLSLAPHCWGSYLGTYKMLQLARGVPGIVTCEIDSLTSDLFDDSDWLLRDGRMYVPDHPGCGLTVREDVFVAKYLPEAWSVGTIPVDPVAR